MRVLRRLLHSYMKVMKKKQAFDSSTSSHYLFFVDCVNELILARSADCLASQICLSSILQFELLLDTCIYTLLLSPRVLRDGS